MSNRLDVAIQNLRQMQNRLRYLEKKLLETRSMQLTQLAKSCEFVDIKITIFIDEFLRLVDCLSHNYSIQTEFINSLLNSIKDDVNGNTPTVEIGKNKIYDNNRQNNIELLNYKDLDIYKNDQLNIFSNDTIIVLTEKFLNDGLVLVKRLTDLGESGYFIIENNKRVTFQVEYFTALDKIFEQSELFVLSMNQQILNELFKVRTYQFNHVNNNLSKTLGVTGSDERSDDDKNQKLVVEVLGLFSKIFVEMRNILLSYVNK